MPDTMLGTARQGQDNKVDKIMQLGMVFVAGIEEESLRHAGRKKRSVNKYEVCVARRTYSTRLDP